MDNRCLKIAGLSVITAILIIGPLFFSTPHIQIQSDTPHKQIQGIKSIALSTTGSKKQLNPVQVAYAFGWKEAPIKPAIKVINVEKPIININWIHYLGSIEDTRGIQWMLYKNDNNGQIIRLRSDGTETENSKIISSTASEIVLEIESSIYSITLR